MKSGRNAYRRTPWWYWGVALWAAVTVLPGAAMVVSADEVPRAPYQAVAQGLVAYPLDALRKYGTSEQIAIETRFVTIGDKVFQEVLPESTMSPLNVDEAGLAKSDAVEPAAFASPAGSHEGAHVARAQLLIEKDSPLRFRIVDKEQGEKLLDRCRADKRSNMIQAPKVTLFNGQTAMVSDTSQSPFVVGVIPVVGPFATAYQPQIRVVSEGTKLRLRPVADRSGAMHLDFAASFAKIQEVGTATFNRTPTDGTTLQIPKVATIRLEGDAVLKPGQWLLLSGADITDQMTTTATKVGPISWKDMLVGGGKQQEPREKQSLILMLRAEKIATDPPRIATFVAPRE